MTPNVQEVAAGVHFVAASHTNLVLVTEGDAVTVIDTGYPRDKQLLQEAVHSIGHRLSDCEALLLTHGHVDHTGCAEWLRREAHLTVQCHEDEVPNTRGRVKQQISELDLLMRMWRPTVLRFTGRAVGNGALLRRSVEEVTTFSDSDTLDVPGSPAAMFTPGHTSGHTGFHLADRGVLVAGDALATVNLWDHADTGPQLVPRPFNHDHDMAAQSLDRYVGVEADVLLPGHGDPWHGTPTDAVELARARR